jgi:hypothetical protein
MVRISATHFGVYLNLFPSYRATATVRPLSQLMGSMADSYSFLLFGGDGRTLEANVGWRELDWKNVKTDLAKDVQNRNRR